MDHLKDFQTTSANKNERANSRERNARNYGRPKTAIVRPGYD